MCFVRQNDQWPLRHLNVDGMLSQCPQISCDILTKTAETARCQSERELPGARTAEIQSIINQATQGVRLRLHLFPMAQERRIVRRRMRLTGKAAEGQLRLSTNGGQGVFNS